MSFSLTTKARGTSPDTTSGIPTTAASLTASSFNNNASNWAGAT